MEGTFARCLRISRLFNYKEINNTAQIIKKFLNFKKLIGLDRFKL